MHTHLRPVLPRTYTHTHVSLTAGLQDFDALYVVPVFQVRTGKIEGLGGAAEEKHSKRGNESYN
jgi:hypothetical protein